MDSMDDETPNPPLGEDPLTAESGLPGATPPPSSEVPPQQQASPSTPPPSSDPTPSWVTYGSEPGPAPGGPFFWVPPTSVPVEPTTAHHAGRKLGVLIGLVALLAGGLGASLDAVLSATGSSPPSVATLPRTGSVGLSPSSDSVSAVASAVEPAVVDINTTVASEVGSGTETGAGTGMIVTRTGEILTNNHVVEQATSIKVTIQGHRGSYNASVIGVDPTQDVALVQLSSPPANLPYVSLGNSSTVKVGTPVVAMGNALGLGGRPSVTSGTVTAINRTITAGDPLSPSATETLHKLFETDAPIESGDSGGPLLNLRGQVIGMDTAAASSDSSTGSLGFAIPINEAHSIVLNMERGRSNSRIIIGETAFLGIVEGQPSFTSPTPAAGVFINGVISGSPAQTSGITGGDTITSINGTTTNSPSALQRIIRAHKPGDSISVNYVDSNGTSHSLSVTLGAIPL